MPDSPEDFLKKYQSSFVLLDNKIPVFVDRLSDKNKDIIYQTPHNGELQIKFTAKNTERFVPYFPSRGLYNIDERAYIFSRMAARQWKRGICSKNTYLRSLLHFLDYYHEQVPRFSHDTIDQLFNPSYPQSLIAAVQTPRLYTLALSQTLGLSISNTTSYDFLLWFISSPIGYVKVSTKTIVLKDTSFTDEVRSYLNQKGTEWTLQIQAQ